MATRHLHRKPSLGHTQQPLVTYFSQALLPKGSRNPEAGAPAGSRDPGGGFQSQTTRELCFVSLATATARNKLHHASRSWDFKCQQAMPL